MRLLGASGRETPLAIDPGRGAPVHSGRGAPSGLFQNERPSSSWEGWPHHENRQSHAGGAASTGARHEDHPRGDARGDCRGISYDGSRRCRHHLQRREAASSHCLRRGSTLALRGWGIPPHPWPKGIIIPFGNPRR